MKAIFRYCLLYLALTSNAQAIGLGVVDASNTYSSVGYTIGTGGTLGNVVALDSEWLLTAAHVVDEPPALIIMGDPNTGAEGIYFFVEQVIPHHNYVPGEFHDDLALIKLSAIDPIIPIPGVVDASFATLSNVDLSFGLPATATLTGYGLTAVDGTLDPNDPILRRFGVAATDLFGPPAPPFDPGFPYDCSLPMLLCTFDTTGGAPGDSGGAMWLDYGGGEMVAGIMSFIFDENDLLNPPETPDWSDGYWTVGMSTAYYEDWITSYVPTAMFGGSTAGEVDADIGGTITTPDGNVVIEIDPGDLFDDATLSITQSGFMDPEVDVFLSSSTYRGVAIGQYVLEPDGLQFQSPVTVTILNDVTLVNPELYDDLDIYQKVDTSIPPDGTLDQFVPKNAACTVTENPVDTFIASCVVQLDHFSIYALIVPLDTDGDGIADKFDLEADNCTLVPNGPDDTSTAGPSQNNADGDDYGNMCDGDLDGSLSVNFSDLVLFKGVFNSADPVADFNGDNAVNFSDLVIFKGLFNQAPGPSGLAP